MHRSRRAQRYEFKCCRYHNNACVILLCASSSGCSCRCVCGCCSRRAFGFQKNAASVKRLAPYGVSAVAALLREVRSVLSPAPSRRLLTRCYPVGGWKPGNIVLRFHQQILERKSLTVRSLWHWIPCCRVQLSYHAGRRGEEYARSDSCIGEVVYAVKTLQKLLWWHWWVLIWLENKLGKLLNKCDTIDMRDSMYAVGAIVQLIDLWRGKRV